MGNYGHESLTLISKPTTDDGQCDIKMPQQITIIINNMTSNGGHLMCHLFQSSQELNSGTKELTWLLKQCEGGGGYSPHSQNVNSITHEGKHTELPVLSKPLISRTRG